MSDPIREDIVNQVSRFIVLLRSTLDPDCYPKVANGKAFDGLLAFVEEEFTRLEKAFNDYLITIWSEEIRERLKKTRTQGLVPHSPLDQD